MEEIKFKKKTDDIQRARKTVNKKIEFYIHLVIYICINFSFHIFNWVEGGEYWAIFPLAFWGMGLIIHFLSVFDVFGQFEWKKKRIVREIERQRRKQNKTI